MAKRTEMYDSPKILGKISRQLEQIYPNIPAKIILNTLLVKVIQMFTSKRITFDESGKIKIPNWFSLVFLPSGGGKDRLVDDLDMFVFSKYHEWYKNEADKLYEQQLEELKLNKEKTKSIKLQKVIEELQNATPEGLYKLAELIKNSSFGSIFIKMSEFGLYIKNAGKQDQKFLSNFCQLYDCKVQGKIIKSEGFIEIIQNIPINVLAYSDSDVFKTDIWSYFKILLDSGLCRRFQVSFQPPIDSVFFERSDEEERNLYQILSAYGDELFEIFEKVQNKSCYRLLPKAKEIFNEYCKWNNTMYNEEPIPLCKAEIKSRCQKIIKLSCIFACINHPEELVINEFDIYQAKFLIEHLSTDFKRFYFYRPQINDKYQKAYDFLKRTMGRGYTKTTLISIFQKECGFTREKLRKNFENEICPIIQEIANADGFDFVSNTDLCKNGTYYFLLKNTDENKPKNSIGIEKILDAMEFDSIKKV